MQLGVGKKTVAPVLQPLEASFLITKSHSPPQEHGELSSRLWGRSLLYFVCLDIPTLIFVLVRARAL